MGVWSTGLYSGDFALDLRSTIRAVARLPYDGERLIEILCETEPGAANHTEDADHSTFWLVAADQFAKRGIVSDRARETALKIIDGGSDLATLEKLGMDPAGLRKRSKVLDEVRARIAAPPSGKPRSTLKNPQEYLMDVGDVLIYPTSGGKSINPYFASKAQDPGWKGTDGWSAFVIVDRGRAFEFLAWYRPVVLARAVTDKPTLPVLRGELLWLYDRAGTCSANHFRKMELEKVGTLPVDSAKLRRAFPKMSPGTSQAISDISIANALFVGPYTPEWLIKKSPSIPRLADILAD